MSPARLPALVLLLAASGFPGAVRGVRIRSESLALAEAPGSRARRAYGRRGPRLSDVRQGELGDCYFLAGIAAIAYRHPDLIEKLFFDQELWSVAERPVYTMKFLINGAETRVAVDDVVPVSRDRRSFAFASASDEDSIWPLLMEKGFAKMFGSYMRISGGRVYDSFKAVTQAPVELLIVDNLSEQDLWSDLLLAEQSSWPVSGSTRSSETELGTTSGHQFVIMQTSEDFKGHGRAVRVFNPWSKNTYRGVLAEDQARGDYWMTYGEFRHAFEDVTVAKVRRGYRVSSRRVKVGAPATLQFFMTENEPFAVQLEWPTSRFMPEQCELGRASFTLLVARAGDPSSPSVGVRAGYSHVSNARADLPGGAGRYLVYVFADFEDAAWLDGVVVNVYAAEDVAILPNRQRPALLTARHMLGFDCDDIAWTGSGDRWFSQQAGLLRGSPTWKAIDSDDVLWFADGEWRVSPTESDPDTYYSNFKGASELQCVQAHPRLDCDHVFWVREGGHRERFVRREPVRGSPAWRHVEREDMILWFLAGKQYRMIASETEPDRFYPNFMGPEELECAEAPPRFECRHIVWTASSGHKQRFTSRSPLRGSPAWKDASREDILWFVGEAEYRIVPSESELGSFYPSFEGPSQLACVDEEVERFATCSRLRWNSRDGRRYDFVQKSPFRGAPAWRETRQGMLLWFDSAWQVSPSEQQVRSFYPSFEPGQLTCVQASLVQEGEGEDLWAGPQPSLPAEAAREVPAFEPEPRGLRPSLEASTRRALEPSALVDVARSASAEAARAASGGDRRACGQLLEHLAEVGRQPGALLARSAAGDPLFPPTSASIASSEAECTNGAGETYDCSRFDRWGRIEDTLERAAEVVRGW